MLQHWQTRPPLVHRIARARLRRSWVFTFSPTIVALYTTYTESCRLFASRSSLTAAPPPRQCTRDSRLISTRRSWVCASSIHDVRVVLSLFLCLCVEFRDIEFSSHGHDIQYRQLSAHARSAGPVAEGLGHPELRRSVCILYCRSVGFRRRGVTIYCACGSNTRFLLSNNDQWMIKLDGFRMEVFCSFHCDNVRSC